MRLNFLFLFVLFAFSSCKIDESIHHSFVGEWEFTHYYSYYYCSECPEPKEITNNVTDAFITGTLYKRIILLANGEVRLYLNHPHILAKEEEHRGTYMVNMDSIFFNLKEVYFDGKKQTITSDPYLYPELDYTLNMEYLKNKNFKYSVQNDELKIFQQDYDRKSGSKWVDVNGVEHTQLGRSARTEKVTYQRK